MFYLVHDKAALNIQPCDEALAGYSSHMEDSRSSYTKHTHKKPRNTLVWKDFPDLYHSNDFTSVGIQTETQHMMCIK